MSRVGEKIKTAREKGKMSQKQLAKKLGVAESFVNDVELGRKIANEQFIQKVSKVLGKEMNDISMSFEEEVHTEIPKSSIKSAVDKKKEAEAKEVWNHAFGDVLKSIPVYDYTLSKVKATRELPVHSNKIEGYSPDKVFFLEIQDDDMLGYRMQKGDIAFCNSIKELENNSICIVEYNGKVVVRYIKKLDNTKVLMFSNKGDIRTETAYIKEIKPLGRLLKLEIKL
ncbi:S24 family peptidase [Clostridium hydrogeniformans]|uniref:S24 family peptidase n=1 Tax=Clostridium hydrogeniformans TaxID=349933 RepID=UPI00048956E7|nr:S24 family peptidase [Clostridium hydrogeniformans]